MKKIVLVLVIFLYNFFVLFGQNELSVTEKLATTAKVWGFLKYYHPEVASGNVDWDKELIELLPKVQKTKNKKELSQLYIELIDELGNIPECKRCNQLKDENRFDKNFDLSWTQNQNIFSEELSKRFKFIESNRFQGKQYYVDYAPAGNVKIINESNYEDLEFPDANYRLLGLFRYWNIIEYFFPYKHLTDEKWDSVLVEMIPKFLSATNKIQYHLVIKELITKINDSHAWIGLEDKSQFKTLPIKLKYIDDKAVVSSFLNDSIANIENLKLGDVILEVNDVPIDSLIKINTRFISASNEASKINFALSDIIYDKSDTIKLLIERSGKKITLYPNRYFFDEFNYYNPKGKVVWKKLQATVGYVNMRFLDVGMIDDMMTSFKATKGIIIDLRSYPRTSFKQLLRYFQSKEQAFYKIYKPNLKYPGTYVFNEGEISKTKKKPYIGKIVILVDEESISLTEFAAMSFQNATNATTIGSQTAGADGSVVVFKYLGGYKTAISGVGIIYSDGTETQRKGVKIDVEIKPTIEGLREGKDEVLEKAIKIINQN